MTTDQDDREESTVPGDTREDAEDAAAEAYSKKLKEQRPSPEEQDRLLDEHEGHLIRHTVSQISESHELADGKMEMTQQAEVPDTYCFTCSEWVGTSGVELTGTPRSKADAFYLGGEPEGVTEARDRAASAVASAASDVIDVHPDITTADEAVQFVIDTAKNTDFVESTNDEQ